MKEEARIIVRIGLIAILRVRVWRNDRFSCLPLVRSSAEIRKRNYHAGVSPEVSCINTAVARNAKGGKCKTTCPMCFDSLSLLEPLNGVSDTVPSQTFFRRKKKERRKERRKLLKGNEI